MCAFRVLQFNIQFRPELDEADPDTAPVNLISRSPRFAGTMPTSFSCRKSSRRCPVAGAAGIRRRTLRRLRAAFPAYDAFFSYPKADPRELPFGIGLAILSKTELADPIRRDLPSPAVEFDFQGERKTPTDRLLIGARQMIAGRQLLDLQYAAAGLSCSNAERDAYSATGSLSSISWRARSIAGPWRLRSALEIKIPLPATADRGESDRPTRSWTRSPARCQTAIRADLPWDRKERVIGGKRSPQSRKVRRRIRLHATGQRLLDFLQENDVGIVPANLGDREIKIDRAVSGSASFQFCRTEC